MQTQRQRELIEAAIHLTATEGIQKLTIRNVAAAIGVSEAAVYRHFESKHALLQAILEHLNTLLAPRFMLLLKQTDTPLAALKIFLDDLFSLLEHNAAFTLMLFAEETFNVDAELRPELMGLLEGNLSHLSSFYASIMEKGLCRTDLRPEQLALITFGTIRLTVSRWHLQKNENSLHAQLDALCNSLQTLFELQ
ncbi:MAG: TetR/AcrR family transcriptional regulator [Sphaerochaeta sp.]|nr:TetR/AcrR family transcriptional regulator [Sphaerochaeta sp.]